ncbi:hypothetical protein B0H14DRAFT_1498044 [Mycena olivaceomarginata]|nr:hypothetical protein B0H14DRAFT_1498044 [Mycena olivaceomarginata]
MEGLRASSSNALIPITVDPSDTLDCQVGLRHGAGLSVFQFSAFAARPIQWVVDKFAADPTASKSFIDDFFGHNDTRETALDDLYEDQDCSSSRFKALQHHLDRLLKLARPKSNTIDSQLMVFKILATVITRYPGVRRRLQTHKDLKKASVRDPSLTSLWNRPDQSCGDEWNFDREFAIFCISDSSLTKLLEAEPPAMLSRVDLGGTLNKVPIEDLMGHSKAGPDFQPFRICAIRYLGGLLELPGFWRRCPPPTGSAPERKRFSEVLCTLCDTILLLLEDTKGVASSYSLRSGRMAVDLLSCAMLKGIIRLHNLDNLPPCPDKLPEIVSILRNDIEGNFPRAFEPSCEVHNMLAILTTVPHHQFNQLEMKFDRDYSGTRLELSYLEHNNNFKPRILLRSTLYPNSQGGNASIHKDIMVCVDGLEISVMRH